MKVVVIGAGVVGMCCAFELQRAGAEVMRRSNGPRSGKACRAATPAGSARASRIRFPRPGSSARVSARSPHGGGPLVIHPSLDPTFVRWLWRFRQSCSRSRWERGVKALLALNERTLELFDDYAEAGVEFEMHRTGLLLVARTPEGLESYKAVFRELKTRRLPRRDHGARPRRGGRAGAGAGPERRSRAASTPASTATSGPRR